MRTRSLAASILAVPLLFAFAGHAFAAQPPLTPSLLAQVGFESPSDSLAVDQSSFPTTAVAPTWGRITQSHLGGSYGFWCSGSTPGLFPYYQAGSYGLAYLKAPDTTGWVTSNVQFSYTEPMVKGGDGQPFRVSWTDASRAATASSLPGEYSRSTLPLNVTSWTTVVIPRGQLVDAGTMGLAAGWLRFQFFSDPSSSGGAQGVTIDDIKISGYEFNAPRNVHAARQHDDHTAVTVTWDKPFGRDGSTVDARDLYYRVWRYDTVAQSWTELTSSDARLHATTCTDTVDAMGSYQYYVQAWDQTSTTGWGILSQPAAVGPAIVRFSTASAMPTTVAYNGATTLSGTLVDEVGDPITGAAGGIVLQRQLAGGSWATVSGVTETGSGVYSATSSSKVNAQYRFFRATGSVTSAAVAVGVQASLPAPSAPKSVKHGSAFTVTGKVSRVGARRTVTLRAYRLEGGKYVLRASTTVKVTAGSGTATYKKSWSLKLKGSYRIYAGVADSYSASTTSGARAITIK